MARLLGRTVPSGNDAIGTIVVRKRPSEVLERPGAEPDRGEGNMNALMSDWILPGPEVALEHWPGIML